MKKVFIYIAICLISNVFYAYGKDNSTMYETEFEKLDEYLYYSPQIVQEKLDSLILVLPAAEQEVYKPHFQYFKGFLAYLEGSYSESLLMIDSAVEIFLYDDKNEWIARCLLLSAFNAEQSMLLDNAEKAYRMVLDYTKDTKFIGLSYAGLARGAKFSGEPFDVNFNKAKECLYLTDNLKLDLYIKQLDAWFYPEAVKEDEIIQLVNSYTHLDMYLQVAMTYKVLSRYYIRINNFHKANDALDCAISICENKYVSSPILSSLYYMKAKIISNYDNSKIVDNLCDKAIRINEEYGLDGINYYIYSFLCKLAKSENRQNDLIEYLEKKVYTSKIHCNDKLERTVIFLNLFDKIAITIEKVEVLKRRYFNIMLCASVLVFLIVGAIILRFNKQKKKFHLLATRLKDDNIILQKKTIFLIRNNKNQQVQHNILVSLHQIEQKIERDIALSKQLPDNFLDEYATMLLLIEKKMHYLTEAEKRYASLFVLNIPQKEISLLLNVSVGTVKTARTRLRVSLGLTNPVIKTNDYLLGILK